jgi:hypothetical protein
LDEQWPVEPRLPNGAPHPLRLIERDAHHTRRLRTHWWARRRFVPVSYADSFRLVYLMMGLVGAFLGAWVLFA